jgi:hypothetical protein
MDSTITRLICTTMIIVSFMSFISNFITYTFLGIHLKYCQMENQFNVSVCLEDIILNLNSNIL